MRISDWSSDVCSSDLHQRALEQRLHKPIRCQEGMKPSFEIADHQQGSDRNVPEIKPIDAQDRTIRQDHPANKGKQHIKGLRSEEHTSELQSLMRISYAVFCLKKKNTIQ